MLRRVVSGTSARWLGKHAQTARYASSRVKHNHDTLVSKGSFLQALDTFPRRHIGPREEDVRSMLHTLGVQSVKELMDKVIPHTIRTNSFEVGRALSESEALAEFKEMMGQNRLLKSFIGAGYYGTKVPNVILRNLIENPGWYTPYTPYQAEIAQGRLEMLLNFQTMVSDLCALPVANASLLDEATAAGEAAIMTFNVSNKKKNVFVVADDCFPQTIDVVKTRVEGVGMTLKVMPASSLEIGDGMLLYSLLTFSKLYMHRCFWSADSVS
jgi:glycine dehydrogenase